MTKARKAALLSPRGLRTLSSKLRLYANESTTVNVLRAERAPGIRAVAQSVVNDIDERYEQKAQTIGPETAVPLEKETLPAITDEVMTAVTDRKFNPGRRICAPLARPFSGCTAGVLRL